MHSLFCITGATGGLGKAFAVECASRGWPLFITDISESALATLAEGLSAAYDVSVFYFPCDLTDNRSRIALTDYMKEKSLFFRGLINVAGLDYEGRFFERTREQIQSLVRLNVEANLEITHALLSLRDTSQTFRIINVASLAAFYPMPVKAMYSASKRFVLNFSMALREELRPLNCTVTALCPAGMPTNEQCIRSIDAQGIAGRITTKNVGYVASNTMEAALKGHAVCIPGILNRILRFGGGLVPQTALAHLIGIRWLAVQTRKRSSKKEVLQNT